MFGRASCSTRRKEILCGFTGDSFRGFALGAIAVPFVTFDYELKYRIASGGVKFDVSAEASVFGRFNPNNELGFSAMVYARRAAYLDAITCTSIAPRLPLKERPLETQCPYTARLTVCGDIAFEGV